MLKIADDNCICSLADRDDALEPGWVPTKIGGPGAPDDMEAARLTQAVSEEPAAKVTGEYFYDIAAPFAATGHARYRTTG